MTRAPDRRLVELGALQEAQARRVDLFGRILLVCVLLGLVVVLGRVVQLKIHPDRRLRPAVGSPTSTRSEMARRGDLLDRRGRVIATSTLGYRLFVDPQMVDDLETIAVDIAHVIGVDPVPLDRAILERRHRRYVVIDHQLEDWQVDAVRNANLRGVDLTPRLVRHYPHGELAAALVGKVGFEHSGLAGVEHRFDDRLTPSHGRLTYLRDAGRNALWIEPADYTPRAHGDDVRLSVDLVIQDIAEQHLRRAVEQRNAGGGRLMVVDPRTGEILAMCDVLNPRTGWEEQTTDPVRDEHPALARNRCVTDPYEPGSTFKPFIWSYATELGKAQLDEVLPTPAHTGYRTSYGRLIRDAYYYGPSTWRRVLVKSMNSGMAIVAERLTQVHMQQAIHRFGFGHKTSCGLPGETEGLVTDPADWTIYTQSSVAMGHEIAVTPVQMVRAFSAFARDGTLPTLRITAVTEENAPYQIVQRAISPATARTTREVMREVMTEGSGRRAQSERYKLFGKSGTAQLPKRNGGGYHEDRYVSSFIAGAPFADPRIVVLCVLDDPDKSKGHYGGEIAGPAVRDVIDDVLNYLGVAADKPQADDENPGRI